MSSSQKCLQENGENDRKFKQPWTTTATWLISGFVQNVNHTEGGDHNENISGTFEYKSKWLGYWDK